MSLRPVKEIIQTKPTIEGAGVRLQRAFGFGKTREFDPFLLLDEIHSDNPDDYGDAAMRCARFILTTLRAHSDIQQAPVEDEYDFSAISASGEIPERGIPLTVKGWPSLLREADPQGYEAAVDGITGFMWGWSCNAARYVLGEPPAPNPALVTIEG